jgi:bacillithiol biosynthesis cysteine-adding enzyme BshC
MFASQHIPYNQTNSFSKLVLHYLQDVETVRPFYGFRPDTEGIQALLKIRKSFAINRPVLVQALREQYASHTSTPAVQANIEALLSDNSFTVCTAHQPNLFTGPLYFVYKVLHTIKLAASLQQQWPDYRFVPVYYMGSEDADFAELNHTFVDGKKIEWKKEQKGAVGRMVVDKTLLQLIDELEGQLVYEPFGKEVVTLLRRCYVSGRTVQDATFELVNELYGDWGLIVLIPDHPLLKAQMAAVFEDELFQNTSSAIVAETSERLEAVYEAQAYPREINLFYLKENIRERIEKTEDGFVVLNANLRFSNDEMKAELQQHPEHFSPNVILRGLYQETILPNLAFIGGGGETAYWLQLKDLFQHFNVPFPVLVLRNSFLIVDEKRRRKLEKIGLTAAELFQKEDDLMKSLVEKYSTHPFSLSGTYEKADALYEQMRVQAEGIDQTLSEYVLAMKARSMKEMKELEKKMLRAEKRKYADQQRQIMAIKDVLFPNNGLQERVENFSGFYAKWGKDFMAQLLQHSPALQQEFTILTVSAPV